MPFTDRTDAGRRLAARLQREVLADPVVLALPRGGVPVAYEVARALPAPLDVIVVRKLGVPYHAELGMGAIGEGGVRLLNERVVRGSGVRDNDIARVEAHEREELERRLRAYRGDRPPVELTGRTAVVVDDGVATGFTARAACAVARERGAARVVLAVPVAPVSVAAAFGDVADTVACLETPRRFVAIGGFYQDFRQLSDAEVFELLRSAAPPDGEITFDADGLTLGGRLTRPLGASAVVVFAHGSGSSRSSPRNRFVADRLADAGFATLLLDLLTPDEAQERRQVFDVIGLAARLRAGTRWLAAQPGASALRLGYFGASTGAAAALIAAAAPDSAVAAVVSRGGRPDLAGDALAAVRAPTLLIVGGRDESVLALNRAAQARLRCRSRLEIVPGAAHLFEEPGALDGVARLAEAWFRRYLAVE